MPHESIAQGVDLLAAAVVASVAQHGDLPDGHTAEPVKVTIEQRSDGVLVGLVWRLVRPDSTSKLRETTWTVDRSLAAHRSGSAA